MRNRHRELVVRKVMADKSTRSEAERLLFLWQGAESIDWVEFDAEFNRLCDGIRLSDNELSWLKSEAAREAAERDEPFVESA